MFVVIIHLKTVHGQHLVTHYSLYFRKYFKTNIINFSILMHLFLSGTIQNKQNTHLPYYIGFALYEEW